MSSIHPILPMELLHLIIDELGNNVDIPSLKACALSCRRLVVPCRKYLFSVVKLQIQECEGGLLVDERYSQFYSLMASSPEIGSYVQSLSIFFSIAVWHPPLDNSPSLFITPLNTLPCILRGLSSLASFELATYALECNWVHLSRDTRAAISGVFALPSLVALSIRNFREVPSAHLADFLRVEKLSIWNIGFQREQAETKRDTPAEDKLKGISIGNMALRDGVILINALKKTSARVENIVITSLELQNFEVVQKVINATPKSILYIGWQPEIFKKDSRELGILDISNLRNLKIISFVAVYKKTNLVARLLEILKTIPAQNVIEEIILEVDFRKINHVLKSCDGGAWKSLDSMLSTHPFLKLTRVVMKLSCVAKDLYDMYKAGGDDVSLPLLLTSFLPSIRDKQILVVDV